MKILVIDYNLFAGLLITQKLARDGHEVVYSSVWGPKSDSPYMDALGKGFPNVKVAPDGWMDWIDWADVATITGSEHKGVITNFLRKHGLPVSGPGKWQAKLELDRQFGKEVFKKVGLNPTDGQRFTDVDELVDYIEANPNRYVFKLDQTARSLSETVVGEDPEGKDIIDVARSLGAQLRFADGAVAMYLDEMVHGTEIGVGGWFNGKKLLGDLMVTYEGHGGYAYDLGLSADKLVNRKKLEAVLSSHKYHGSVDINGFLTEDDEYRPIEWTPRWGGGTTEFFCHATPDLGKLLYACATGGEAQVLSDNVKGKIGVIVNARDESDEMDTPMDVILPKGKMPPFFLDSSSSFWVMWPTKTKRGWMSLPVIGEQERRVGMYVTIADTFDKALDKVDAVSEEAKIAGSVVESGRMEDELKDLLTKGREFILGEDWIREASRSPGFRR
jgi:phosphoribosylamine--glycine ligase